MNDEVAPGRVPKLSPRVRRVLALVAAAAALVVVGFTLGLLVLYHQLPEMDRLVNYQPKQPLRVFTSDGVEIGQFGTERRILVPIEEVPPLMQEAVIAVEDKRFREHAGVDLKGVLRAVFVNLTHSRIEGASTITQQVARNFFLSSKRTYGRKIREALLAWKIERHLDKPHVLELYMNQIYLGHRSYGFEAAAATYFGKRMAELSVAEVAMLAGLPQNPVHANPLTDLQRATARQRVVLQRMLSAGVIDPATYETAQAEPLQLRERTPTEVHAEHAAEMARQTVYARYGAEAYTLGLKVYTTLNSREQEAAHRAVRAGVLAHERRQAWRGPEAQEELPTDVPDGDPAVAQLLAEHEDDEDLRVAVVTAASTNAVQATLATGESVRITGDGLRVARAGLSRRAKPALAVRRGSVIRLVQQGKGWAIAQWPQVEAALVAIDAHDGRLRALVGGFDFRRNQFNHAQQAQRQPGSAFKPFVYSAAFEHGVMPSTLVNDAPLVDAVSGWSPKNADGEFDGPMPLRVALARSKNLVSIRLAQHLGVNTVRDWAARFGFERDKLPANLTLALGSGSVTPVQLAAGYAVFANGGLQVQPVLIERIVDAQGQTVFEAGVQPASEAQRVIPARNAFLTNQLLQEVTRHGTAARAQTALQRSDLYGKTGTTDEAVDAWFAGHAGPAPGLVAVVWLGHDEPRSLGDRESGGGLALPVWIDFMRQALRDVPRGTPSAPEGVVQVDGEWLYSEFAEGGQVDGIGLDEPVPDAEPSSEPNSAQPTAVDPASPLTWGLPPPTPPAQPKGF